MAYLERGWESELVNIRQLYALQRGTWHSQACPDMLNSVHRFPCCPIRIASNSVGVQWLTILRAATILADHPEQKYDSLRWQCL